MNIFWSPGQKSLFVAYYHHCCGYSVAEAEEGWARLLKGKQPFTRDDTEPATSKTYHEFERDKYPTIKGLDDENIIEGEIVD